MAPENNEIPQNHRIECEELRAELKTIAAAFREVDEALGCLSRTDIPKLEDQRSVAATVRNLKVLLRDEKKLIETIRDFAQTARLIEQGAR